MPTNATGLRIERQKAPTTPIDGSAGVAVLFMACLVGGLVLLSYFFGVPDLSEVAQLVGP
jgi:hypothetical protein